jgi:S-DNA-T family DNA segregation ATPase FtsK/SpoIIIE
VSSFDREVERGLEALLRPLLEPPTVYVLGLVLVGSYVVWRERPVLVGTLHFGSAHRVLIVLVLLVLLSLALAAALGVLWALRKWQRRAERSKLATDWPELAEGLQLSGSSVLRVQHDQGGQTVRLQLNRFRGQTSADLVAKLPRLESALQVRPGAVRVMPDSMRADLCTLRLVERDPLAKAIPWTAPAVTSVTEPVTLGLFEDHQPMQLRLWQPDRQRHVLIAGVNGSGKSGLINVALGSLTRCRDLVLWGVDLKGGMEFSAWKPALDRLATSPADACTLLEAANRVLDARMELLAGRNWRRWRPTAEEPLLLVVVDEISELDPAGLALVQRIARLGRAPGVQLIIATQRPSAQQLESTDESGVALRGQLHTRICMRVTETREADMILGGGLVREGWRADRLLREPGTFLISDAPEHAQPVPARCFWMSDSTVQAAVADCRELRPRLDPTSVGAALTQQADAASAAEESTDQPEAGTSVDSPHDPDARILALLRQRGPEGLSGDDLAAGLQGLRGRTWVYQRLPVLTERGLIRRIDKGRWAIV